MNSLQFIAQVIDDLSKQLPPSVRAALLEKAQQAINDIEKHIVPVPTEDVPSE